jgi:predicted AlkP superfamily pyrophosphatase or phosphodiesterase
MTNETDIFHHPANESDALPADDYAREDDHDDECLYENWDPADFDYGD